MIALGLSTVNIIYIFDQECKRKFYRCKDRTESGSFLGAFLCTEFKCGGPMVKFWSHWINDYLNFQVPQNPRDEESDYICLNCGHSFSNKYAQRILKNAETDIRNIDQALDLLQHLEVIECTMFYLHNQDLDALFLSEVDWLQIKHFASK